MVGGSVNGRPFREDPDSYSKTGIGCGHPKRFKSRAVIRMTPYSGRPARLPEGVANEEGTETEGERQLKRILDQQLDTQLTLQQQYLRHRTFQPSSTYVPITKEISGKLSSAEFQACEVQKQQVDDLREMGLDSQELTLKLQQDGLYEKDQSSFGKEPSILKLQLEAIQAKLDTKMTELLKPNTFREAKQLSRHEMDLEKSLKPTSQQTQLLRNLVTVKKRSPDEIHPDHPINHLKDLEQELLERVHSAHLEKKENLTTLNVSKRLPKASSSLGDQRTNSNLDEKVATATDALLLLGSDLFTNWTGGGLRLNESQVEPKTEPLFSKNDPVVRAYIVPIPKEEIENNRLSLEQIIQLPRFSNYSPGEPSATLYLKNLANDVEETDLIALFSRYQKNPTENLEYRLMKGKMKGQAFVKFPTVETATNALQFVNGFMWKEKPIIIQYGHQDDTIKKVRQSL